METDVVSENLEPEKINENDSQEKILPEVINVNYDNVEDDETLKGTLVIRSRPDLGLSLDSKSAD